MNKRIQELYKQAYGHFPCPAGEPETERFAELIVRECSRHIEDNFDFCGDIAESVLKHFGKS